jgi:hypothetical protein
VPRYEELYSRGAYMPSKERDRLTARARAKRRPRRSTPEPTLRRGTQRPPAKRGSAEPRVRQTTLF